MNRVMVVGLTGGIGSGKSEVSSRFEQLGINIVDADVVAREVVVRGSYALNKIAEHFGLEILQQDGSLDRQKLRERVFNNLQEKTWLENLLHPIIRNDIINQLNQSKSPYAILASPLLLETSQHELVDRILVVDATEELQIARASLRDTNNAEQIKKIMATQMDRSIRCAKADDIIHNHGDIHELELQVHQLHVHYLELTQILRNQPMHTTNESEPIQLNCPTCKKLVWWTEEYPHRPFCSDRCRLIDLGEWASENHKIAGDSLNVNPEENADDF